MARYKNLQSQHETISIGLSGLKRELAYINQNNRRVNMDSFIGPSEVQKVMQDIIGFKKNSKVPEKEQIRILQLLEDYYRMRNMNDLDVVLSNLIKSVLAKDYDVIDNPVIE